MADRTGRTYSDVFDFTVIDEREDWIVVDKPAPLQVHPSKPGGPPTLWHGLRLLLAYDLANGATLSIVNRLDRETSGLVLVAKNKRAAREFNKAMLRREVVKEYRVIVAGWPPEDGWTVDAPILRRGEVEESPIYLMQKVHPAGAEARTDFRVLRRFERPGGGRFALLAAFLHTGRMHQIRVHASHSGFPVVGDKLYGPDERWYLRQIERGWTPEARAALLLPRHALHSCRLGVTVKTEPERDDNGGGSAENRRYYEWFAPLPADMAGFMEGET